MNSNRKVYLSIAAGCAVMVSLVLINGTYDIRNDSLGAQGVVLANADSSGVTTYIVYPE